MRARNKDSHWSQPCHIAGPYLRWHKPPISFLKCNSDVAIFNDTYSAGLGSVLRDANEAFVACCVSVLSNLPSVKECEALALLDAMTWVYNRLFKNVIFKLDAKGVVDVVNSSVNDITEFGSIDSCCCSFLAQAKTYLVSFVKRQANDAAHALAREACFHACSHLCYDMPNCLATVMNNVCHIKGH
ncbi:hypothetical protein DITRI_Ditri14bG0096800 [Diplodiscus trichospermus]